MYSEMVKSYAGQVGFESIDERMVVVIPKGAVAKDPRPAPGSVLPSAATDLKVHFFFQRFFSFFQGFIRFF